MMRNVGFFSVDGGNTRLKATLLPSDEALDKGQQPEVRSFEKADVERLMEWVEEICAKGEMEGCAMAAVGHVDPRLAESLRNRIGDSRFLLITPATELPVKVAYATPHTLGIDRKAAACGAVEKWGRNKMIVIDAGSAVTLDLIGEDGEFLGGRISPGLKMRFRSLHEFTSALPLIEDAGSDDVEWLGTDTRTAIIAGAEGGWLEEIAGAIRHWSRQGWRKVLLCGGDAALLRRLLATPHARDIMDSEDLEIIEEPHLVAIGMRMIYRHHEK